MAHENLAAELSFMTLWEQNDLHQHYVETIPARDLHFREALYLDLQSNHPDRTPFSDTFMQSVIDEVELVYNLSPEDRNNLLNACEQALCEEEAECSQLGATPVHLPQ